MSEGPRGRIERLPEYSLEWDTRLGGDPRLVITGAKPLVQVPDSIRDCVAFLGAKLPDRYIVGGTVFFVAYPLAGTEGPVNACYAITASHCLEALKEKGHTEVHVRCNMRSGKAQFVATGITEWICNEDPRIDVAVHPIYKNAQHLKHRFYPVASFANDKVLADFSVGLGDDLFFPGLFTRYYGEENNIPIIRTGTIAAMPEDPIKTRIGPIRAYLAEARSIGGFSGSPVFFYPGFARMLDKTVVVGTGLGIPGSPPGPSKHMPFFLLGMVHGHFAVKDTAGEIGDAVLQDSLDQTLNMGIAIVIPASDILATLNQPKLVEQREIFTQKVLQQKAQELPEMD